MKKPNLQSKKFVVVISTLFALTAWAQQPKLVDLPFTLGDSINTVRSATNGDVEAMTKSGGEVVPFIHLKDRGIWIFFSQQKTVESIRLNSPYSGYVAGVKVGETEQALQTIMGNPVKTPWVFGKSKAYLYELSPEANARYDVSTDGKVENIFVMYKAR